MILLFVILGTPLFGQEEGVTPAPYSPDEFPGWAKDLRRGEVIALGVFPVALILTQLTYDLARFGVESVQAGEVDREAAPWFFAPPGVQRFSQQEKETILITSAVVSVVFAVVDYALGRRERRRSEQP